MTRACAHRNLTPYQQPPAKFRIVGLEFFVKLFSVRTRLRSTCW